MVFNTPVILLSILAHWLKTVSLELFRCACWLPEHFTIFIYLFILICCHITTAQVPWWVKFLRACSRQCKKKKCTYRQYILTDCTEDNVQKNTYIYSVHTVYYKDILSYQYTLYTVCTHSTLCTHLYIVIGEGETDYTYAMSWMCIVWYPVIADRLCLCSVCV